MKKLFLSIGLIILLSTVIVYSQSSEYEVSGTINIGGEGFWDYTVVDAPMQRLYVSHATKVHVIDLSTNKVIGEISDLQGVHGIALAEKLGKGFICNGKNDMVTVFDLKSLKTIGNIQVTGKGPDAITYDPFTNRIFTFNGNSNNSTVIDAATDSIVGTVTLDGKPEFSVSNNRGLIYVNIESKNLIEVFNSKNLKIVAEWPTAPGESPAALAIDLKNNILFSGCHNKLMAVLNAKSGKIITTLPIGGRVDASTFDPGTNLAFSSNGDGTVTVIHEVTPTKFKVVENIPTQKGLRTMALDPLTHKIYLIGMLNGKDNSKYFGVLIMKMK